MIHNLFPRAEVRILQNSRKSGDIFYGYEWGPRNSVPCGTFTENDGICPRKMNCEHKKLAMDKFRTHTHTPTHTQYIHTHTHVHTHAHTHAHTPQTTHTDTYTHRHIHTHTRTHAHTHTRTYTYTYTHTHTHTRTHMHTHTHTHTCVSLSVGLSVCASVRLRRPHRRIHLVCLFVACFPYHFLCGSGVGFISHICVY